MTKDTPITKAEKKRAYSRAYYQANKEKIMAKRKERGR